MTDFAVTGLGLAPGEVVACKGVASVWPCPPWCGIDHRRRREVSGAVADAVPVHQAAAGAIVHPSAGRVSVRLVQHGDDGPKVYVSALADDGWPMFLTPAAAEPFAALVGLLGHADLAAAVRRAAALAGQGEENGGQW